MLQNGRQELPVAIYCEPNTTIFIDTTHTKLDKAVCIYARFSLKEKQSVIFFLIKKMKYFKIYNLHTINLFFFICLKLSPGLSISDSDFQP